MPPLHGVPFTVKENIDLAGSATTQGLAAFEEAFPDRDAPHIAQLRAAGAIPLARTNLPDFGFRWHTDNALRRPDRRTRGTRSRSPGGSSGGEAAALATGMSPLGIGQRLRRFAARPRPVLRHLRPAAHVRPGADATAFAPEDFPITLQLMAVQGPMARRVADLRLALRHMCGDGPAGIRGGHPRPSTVRRSRGGSPCGGRRTTRTSPPESTPPRHALADAGYDIDEIEPPMVAEAARLWENLVASDARILVAMLRPAFGADALRFIDSIFELRPDLDKSGYVEGLVARQGVARAWSRFQAERPLILGPVSTRSPFPVGRDLEGPSAVSEILRQHAPRRRRQPARTAGRRGARGRRRAGCPQGVQLIGPRYREDLCLDAAQAIEDRLGVLTPIDPV